MTNQETLPATTSMADVALHPDQSGSLVARGLEAVKHRSNQSFSSTIESDPHHLARNAYDRGDYATALKLIRPLAEQGDSLGQRRLGRLYQYGEGVTQSDAEAVKWYRRAAERGDAHAQYILGIMCKNGNGVTKDYEEAVKWLRNAAEQGLASAQFNLGRMYEKGQGVQQDFAEAVKWYRKAAEQGNVDGQFHLGFSYHHGLGVPKDYAEAVKWYHKVDAQGYFNNGAAQLSLGFIYCEDETQDYAEAARWFQKAAEQGCVSAERRLGWMYLKGEGVQRNVTESLKWYRKVAELGGKYDQSALARAYYEVRDYAEAMRWFRIAVENGCVLGPAFTIGYMYYKGQGVKQDCEEAVKWFTKEASRGSGRAQLRVGFILSKEIGLPKDYVQAYKWLTFAAMEYGTLIEGERDIDWRRQKKAITLRNQVEGMMLPEEVAEAKQLVIKRQGLER